MLSRIAESLFWIGRYVERADNTARLLDVHLNVLLEDPWVDEPSANASLLAVMNCEFTAPVTRHDVLERARVRPDSSSSSIAGTLTAARENARRAREVISTEVWESLNTTRDQLPRWTRSARPHEYFVWVRERAAVVWGLSSAHHVSRRRVALHGTWPLARASGHDRAPAHDPPLRGHHRPQLDHAAAHRAPRTRRTCAPCARSSPRSAPQSSCWSTAFSRARSPTTSRRRKTTLGLDRGRVEQPRR